jgi:hypothetical protein
MLAADAEARLGMTAQAAARAAFPDDPAEPLPELEQSSMANRRSQAR